MSVKDYPRRTVFLVSAFLVSLALASINIGCSDSGSPNGGSGNDPRFTPKNAQIVVGDTIRWVATNGVHSVTSGTGSSDPNVGQLFDQNLSQGQSFTRVFDQPGTVPYFCRPHEADGMTGTVTAAPLTAKTVAVSASGTSFSPANVTINIGDAVRWTASGAHTVTSGTGSGAADAGDLFDQPLTNGQTFTFTFNTLGTFPYFCRPHEGLGMKGTVTVVIPKAKTVEVQATQ